MRDYSELLQARQILGPLGALDFLIDDALKRATDCEIGSPLQAVLGASEVNSAEGEDVEVSVVMTAYNSSAEIRKSIESVLAQTFKNFELIVVDDCSSDDTASIVSSIAEKDPRVRLIRCRENRGTYWAKNLGILHTRGQFIALHDSDDVSRPERLGAQVRALHSTQAKICYTSWVRVDTLGRVVENRGLRERLGYPTAMFPRQLIDQIGFFDSVRVAADDEFHKRILAVYGRASVLHIERPLYVAPLSENSLTGKNPVKMFLEDDSDALSFLSRSRRQYVDCYSRWHCSGKPLVVPFPMRTRPFPAPSEIVVNAFSQDEKYIASIASIPSRRKGLEAVIASLRTQVDEIHVHLNNYDDVPAFLEKEDIFVTTSGQFGDLRDNGKYLGAESLPRCFHFTVDDDIAYPNFYVNYLVSKILQYGRRAAVGLHGTILCETFRRYHDGRSRDTRSFYLGNECDFQVDILGTGACAYHTDALRFSEKDAPTKGMVDIWFAIKAKLESIPLICVERREGWLTEQRGLSERSLYTEFISSDQQQTALIKSKRPWLKLR